MTSAPPRYASMRIREVAHTVAPLDRDLPAAESVDGSPGELILERYQAICCRCRTVLDFEATSADRKAGWDDKATLLRVAHKWSFFQIRGDVATNGWLCQECAREVMRHLERPE